MASKPKDKLMNTPMQDAFLEALRGEAQGDIYLAKKLAGYSDGTAMRDIIGPLREQIVDVAEALLATHAVKAVHGLLSVIDAPSMMGASNRIKAATELLDRIGMIKKDNGPVVVPEGSIFILPPKKTVDKPESDS